MSGADVSPLGSLCSAPISVIRLEWCNAGLICKTDLRQVDDLFSFKRMKINVVILYLNEKSRKRAILL